MRRRHSQLDFEGSIHFVTTVTAIRGQWFVDPQICEWILRRLETCRERFGLDCLGYMLMPDHLHVLLRQNNDGPIVSRFMQAFKRQVSAYNRPSNYSGKALWRIGYDDVPILNIEAVRVRLKYMHENALRKGNGSGIEDYPWSSARDYLEISSGIVTVYKLI
jgi:putative transposase